MHDILLIVNPASGKYNKNKVEKLAKILGSKVDNINIALTEYRGHATDIAKNAKEKIVIAAGGDGMINEVAQGISCTDKLFYALPIGTVNVFCKEYGIGRNAYKAARKFQINNIKKIPVGYIDDKIFLLMAGFGFDAHIVKKVEEKGIKFRPLKTLVHIMYGFPAFFSDKYERIYSYQNGKRLGFYHGVFAVAASYAGTYKLGNIKDNMINAFLISNSGRLALFRAFAPLFFRFGFNGTYINSDYFKINGAEYCQLDGEYTDLSSTSNYITIKQNAINLLLPIKK